MVLEGDELDFEEAWRVFTVLEALAGGADKPWQFLPSDVLSQPEPLLSNVLRIKHLRRQIEHVTK